MNRTSTVVRWALLSRLFVFLVATSVRLVAKDYDTSLDVLISSENPTWLQQLVSAFARWDSVHFLGISSHGYMYEHAHAFFPGMLMTMRYAASTVLKPIADVHGDVATQILAGVIISNAAFVAAAAVLYKLTPSSSKYDDRFALVTAALFILTPSNMVMSAVYTESVFAFFSFSCMYFVAKRHRLLAALMASLATSVRSNGLLLVGFFIFDALFERTSSGASKYSHSSLAFKITRTIGNGVVLIVQILAVFAPFVAFQRFGFTQFCSTVDGSEVSIEQSPWCNARIPLLYSYVQDHYWDNGFLKYYKLKQLPNFLIAAPMLSISLLGLYRYAISDWTRFVSLGLQRHSVHQPFFRSALLPHMYLLGFVSLWCALFMHVQVYIRFMTSYPAVYWCTAYFVTTSIKQKDIARTRKISLGWTGAIIITYFLLYGISSIPLFALFYPPA
ncbi:mannosyltransferase [Ramicandelaber brevisporus]|nr:mannosyltransferase [Ramicandelaber brevisporus]